MALAQALVKNSHEREGLGAVGRLIENLLKKPLRLLEVPLVECPLHGCEIDDGRCQLDGDAEAPEPSRCNTELRSQDVPSACS